MENKQMVGQSWKDPPFAKCVARKVLQFTLEITLRPTIWKEYLFHVITVTRPFLQDRARKNTKGYSINKLIIFTILNKLMYDLFCQGQKHHYLQRC